MPRIIRLALGTFIALAMFAGGVFGQRRPLEPDDRIMSGSDVGFRVESRDLAGRALWTRRPPAAPRTEPPLVP
jgi:hypothetical protein